ncbi:MAG: DEAD/DEAH box helicase [bacterium]|nr:DEAD/DEAH box helicase [bacterium]
MSSFQDFQLAEPVLRAVADVGYESPSPIQAASIPALLEGRDLVGQAQTGTGKTAAFALPLLSRLDPSTKDPQILVLAPTRELAIQVAEAFQTYGRHLKNFNILPVYGGQGMDTQLRGLRRGVQVIVGTPGRVIDHLKRKTLKLGKLQALVLDEADEMLKMGFIDDVEWILEQSPETRQVALFSATLPDRIRNIARKHLNEPVEIKIKSKTSTVDTITQRYWPVGGVHKLDALTRILEVEDFDAMIIFVRTKNATVELAEKLEARGFSASAINGDMNQALREKTIDRLKKSKLDILVATDVAARGLDVERISHVVNYDIPYDTEAYIHRIGRTGRAGRKGQAILFVAPRETRMLRTIERATKQPITQMGLPTRKDIADRRIVQFKEQLDQVLEDTENLNDYAQVILDYVQERNAVAQDAGRDSQDGESATDFSDGTDSATDGSGEERSEGAMVAQAAGDSAKAGESAVDTAPALTLEQVIGALTFLVQQERPFHFKKADGKKGDAKKSAKGDGPKTKTKAGASKTDSQAFTSNSYDSDARRGPAKPARDKASARDAALSGREPRPRNAAGYGDEERPKARREKTHEFEMERFRVAVGKDDGVEPKHIVGAIANEAGLDSQYIGEIKLYDSYSTVDLPEGIPKEILKILKKARVMGRKMDLSPEIQVQAGHESRPGSAPPPAGRKPKEKTPKAKAKLTTKPEASSRAPANAKSKAPAGAKPKAGAKAKKKSGVGVRSLTKAAKPAAKKIRLKKKSASKKGS